MILRSEPCRSLPSTISFFAVLLATVAGCGASNILILAPFQGKSHSAIVQTVGLHMASRGHNVTVVATYLVDKPPPNYRQIAVEKNPVVDFYDEHFVFERTKMTAYQQLYYLWLFGAENSEFVLNSPEVKDFLQNDKSHFDVVISELFYQEPLYMFAQKYNAPLVLLGTTTFPAYAADFMGNPMHFTCSVHDQFREFGGIPLYRRLKNMLLFTYEKLYRRFVYMPKCNEIAKKYFTNVTNNVPSLEELQRNVSLVLINSHFSMDQVIPLVPGVVEYGGIHIDPKKPSTMPKDIKKFLDESKHGVIYFAFGSHLKATKLTPEKLKAFTDVFATLKQRILWKWEGDDPPNLPNAMFKKWLPQIEILSHPNVKTFITHSGMLGTQEAVYHGVPMVGIPIFSDQYRNINELVRRYASVKVDFRKLTNTSLEYALDQVLNNGTYRERMKLVSERFRDRFNTPKETVAYWIEYVIKHRGHEFMKSPLAYLNVGQYYFIEIAVVVLFFVSIGLLIFTKNVLIFLALTAKPYIFPEKETKKDLKETANGTTDKEKVH